MCGQTFMNLLMTTNQQHMDYCIVKNESKHIGFVVMVTIVIDIGVIHVSAHQTRQTLSCTTIFLA